MSDRRALIDWRIAEFTAARLARRGEETPDPERLSRDELEAICAEAIGIAAEHAGLGPVESAPQPEPLRRDEWARNALASLADAVGPLEARLAENLELPEPLGSVARRAVAAAAGAEAGLAAGYAAGRVLGQYDVAVFGPARPARLLFVPENIERARRRFDAEPRVFASWIAVHECTHVVQFERVEWLTAHLGALIGELLDGAADRLGSGGVGELARRLLRDPGESARRLLRGELVRLLADPAQRATLDRVQATMAVVEGYAEWVMDEAAEQLGPDVAELRRRLDSSRERRGGLGELVGRLLGFDLKLRQYRLGKRFCDELAATGGPEELRRLWERPENLPDVPELERPDRWRARIRGAVV